MVVQPMPIVKLDVHINFTATVEADPKTITDNIVLHISDDNKSEAEIFKLVDEIIKHVIQKKYNLGRIISIDNVNTSVQPVNRSLFP